MDNLVGVLILSLFVVALWIVGGATLYFRHQMRQKVSAMGETETCSAADVSGLAVGTQVEVKGILRCDEPLTSEMAGRECAYYSSRVMRTSTVPDSQDHAGPHRGSHRSTETLAHNEQFAPFAVEDPSGTVPVRLEGADVDALRVMDRFEEYTGEEGAGLTLGGVWVNLDGGRRTLGFEYQEDILPVDVPVYVLGAVNDGDWIGPPLPGNADQRFVVSRRSEEELGTSLGKNAFWLGIGAVGAFVVGAIMLAITLVVLLG